VLDAVGGTPLIRLRRTGVRARVYVKPEWYNPGASSKDRAALAMVRRAEDEGLLGPGGTVVETTSGNTGIGLAVVAAVLGYRAVVFTSSAISREKRDLLRAHGAEVRLVDAFVPRSHPDSLRSVAERYVAATEGAWLADQYDNPANPDAHYRTTGPEIWADTAGSVTHLVATVGTGGTISGTGRYLKEVSGGSVEVVGADPFTSAYGGGDGSQKAVEGAGHAVHPEAEVDVWPRSFDPGVVDRFVRVGDQAAIDALHRLAHDEGILAGGSSGVALVAALEVARDLDEDATVVAVLPDSGRAYLSTYFDPVWLRDHGFRDDPAPHVRDALAGPLSLVGRDASATEVSAATRSAAEDTPVLVVHPRGGDVLPHPTDVVGWARAGDLRAAADAAPRPVRPVPLTLGAGTAAGAGLALADAREPEWEVALALEEGRVVGLVKRDHLVAVARGTVLSTP
jgi:cystathionine beta-synthase